MDKDCEMEDKESLQQDVDNLIELSKIGHSPSTQRNASDAYRP